MAIVFISTRTEYIIYIIFVLFLIVPSITFAQTNVTVSSNSSASNVNVPCPSGCSCFSSAVRNVSVVWGYNGHICAGQSSSQCYGEDDPRGFIAGPRQWPVIIQQGDRLFFKAATKVALSIKPFNATKNGFDGCAFDGMQVISSLTSSLFEISTEFIATSGIKYFISESNNKLYQCQFGLKLEVYVRSRQPCINPSLQGSTVCSNKGLCATCTNGNFFTFNSSCVCETGYIGSYCEERNSCHSSMNPCRNGATCVDKQSGLTNDYECRCPPGYSGKQCESNIDDCKPDSPCKNGAICIDSVNTYNCLCAPGYHGKNCSDLRPNPCEPNPCVNGGTCSLDGNSRLNYTCKCPDVFGGRNCSDNVTISSSVPVFSTVVVTSVANETSSVTVSATTLKPSMSTTVTTSVDPAAESTSKVSSIGPSISTSVETGISSDIIAATTSSYTMTSSISSTMTTTATTTVLPTPPLLSTEPLTMTVTSEVVSSMTVSPTSIATLVATSSILVPTTTPTVAPTTVPLKELTCKNNPCDSGTCLDIPDSIGFNFTCQCPKPTYGPRCSTDFKLHFPRFGNNSYLVHKPIAFSVGFNKIVITFKTTKENGLLFYSTHRRYRDFIQLYIRNGELEYRFDPGDSLVAIRSSVKVNTGKIVTAVLTYDSSNKEGTLKVDNNEPKKVRARGNNIGIGLYSEWYIGGLPPGKTFGVNDEAKVTPTLDGCIKDLELNGDQIGFTEAIDWNNLNECDKPCDHKPCHHNGNCTDDINDPHDYQCTCPTGFEGKNCKNYTICSGDPCKGGLCVVDVAKGSKECLCPYGRAGRTCELDLNITVPCFSMAYNYSSYIQYQSPVRSGPYFAITLQFKLKSSATALESGLLMFSGQDQYQGKGDDFVALGISSGKVVFQYNLGSGIAKISSDVLDKNLEWHSVTAGRNKKEGFLYVDNQGSKGGDSPGELSGLNLYSPLYIGGLPDLTELPSNVQFKSGFQGCITNMAVRFGSLEPFVHLLMSQSSGGSAWPVVAGRNIVEKDYDGCNSSNPCQNNGTCVTKGASVTCSCINGWKGMFCSSQAIPCINHNPCASKSTCREANNKAVCDCPLGKTGSSCSKSVSIQKPRFNENSYMAFNPANASGQTIYIRTDTNIKITFTPTNANGLLFYVTHKISSQRDFLSVSLHNGFVLYYYDLGSGPAKLQSQKAISLNSEHILEVTRTSKTGSLKVDGEAVVSGTSPGNAVALDVESDFYLGGVPQLSSVNPSAIFDSKSLKDFVGCVTSVKVNQITLTLTESGAKEGRNIDNCPSPILS